MHKLHGACHCGSVSVGFTTAQDPAGIEVRACQCTFCRRHGAKTFSDPTGHAAIVSAEALNRYRFATATADFLLCGNCGCFIGAFLEHAGQGYITLNAAGLAMQPMAGAATTQITYDAEDGASRAARRIARWTPATVTQ